MQITAALCKNGTILPAVCRLGRQMGQPRQHAGTVARLAVDTSGTLPQPLKMLRRRYAGGFMQCHMMLCTVCSLLLWCTELWSGACGPPRLISRPAGSCQISSWCGVLCLAGRALRNDPILCRLPAL